MSVSYKRLILSLDGPEFDSSLPSTRRKREKKTYVCQRQRRPLLGQCPSLHLPFLLHPPLSLLVSLDPAVVSVLSLSPCGLACFLC